MKKRTWFIGFFAILLLLTTLLFYFVSPIINGYAAKMTCSCVFVANRSLADIQAIDLGFSPVNLAQVSVNKAEKTASASLLGLFSKTAYYHPSLGCALMNIDKKRPPFQLPALAYPQQDNLFWPYGNVQSDTVFSGINYVEIEAAAQTLFENIGGEAHKTAAIIVSYKDHIILEKYGDNITKDTPLLGWSMTKSIMSTLAGMRIADGQLDLEKPLGIPTWATDERANIHLKHLLQMTDGLDFEEVYQRPSGATKMLYESEDFYDVATSNQATYPAGEHFNYSSGTSNIVSGVIAQSFDNHTDYLAYPYQRLFYKIGMNSARLETDAKGLYVGSSYTYATARDWTRFGLLYAKNGIWNGEQIISTDWIDFVQTESKPSAGIYGGHFWLSKSEAKKHPKSDSYYVPNMPDDFFYARGFQGQRVYIIPSKDLVVVRLGMKDNPTALNTMVSRICAAVE